VPLCYSACADKKLEGYFNWYLLTVFDRDDFNRELFTVYEIIKRAKTVTQSGFMKCLIKSLYTHVSHLKQREYVNYET